jgi:hypothetical protein
VAQTDSKAVTHYQTGISDEESVAMKRLRTTWDAK